VNRRISQHTDKEFNFIHFIEYSNEIDARNDESYYIMEFLPILNKHIPTKTIVKNRLPKKPTKKLIIKKAVNKIDCKKITKLDLDNRYNSIHKVFDCKLIDRKLTISDNSFTKSNDKYLFKVESLVYIGDIGHDLYYINGSYYEQPIGFIGKLTQRLF
jgi:hypothetical protein